MNKKILFMYFNKLTSTISGAADKDLTVIDGAEFPKAIKVKLPKSELTRFETENNLQWNQEYKIYNLGGQNSVMLLTNCKFISCDNYGVYTYSADSWSWV